MEDLFFIGNWKSFGTLEQASEWINSFPQDLKTSSKIIICPPFTLLSFFKEQILKKSLPIILGAQDVSEFDEGAYTGEVNAKQLKDLGVSFCIVGHSERRKYFSESIEQVNKKIQKLQDNGIHPIVCVSNEEELAGVLSNEKMLVAYEVFENVGTGNPADPNKVFDFMQRITNKGFVPLYGGSVNSENVVNYITGSSKGVLIGGESKSSLSFVEIIKKNK